MSKKVLPIANLYLFGLCLVAARTTAAQTGRAEPLSALAKMPVKEITVFKDGHALVLHEGRMPTNANGNVVMDYLPTPVLGTFWPYSAEKGVKLSAVTAGVRRVKAERTALSLRELLEANVGAAVWVTELGDKGSEKRYEAVIVGIPERSSEEVEATSPPNSGEQLPVKGNLILLKTAEGVKAMDISRVSDVVFKDPHKAKGTSEEFRNLLTLQLDWGGQTAEKTAEVGLLYVQKGVRWIPSYKISLDGKGNAHVKLQATLLNELTDLDDVTANLVIGVPSFAFKDTVDPISMQGAFAQLSPYFQADAQTPGALSNAIMSQAGGGGGFGGGGFGGRRAVAETPSSLDVAPEMTGSEKNEDLFVFTVKHIRLKKGQRMVLPVADYVLPYKDVFTLDLPIAPPNEVRQQFNPNQNAELVKLLSAPKVMHKIRLTNKSAYPLTTAPALILNGDRVIGQGLMTYASVNSEADMTLTTAVDVKVKKAEKETKRTPNVVIWLNQQYGRIDLSGTLTLTNFRTEKADLEVTRYVLGSVDEVGQNGKAEMVNALEEDDTVSVGDQPYWWGWYSWPSWWGHFNGIGRFTWKLALEPSKSVDLTYAWHYFWR